MCAVERLSLGSPADPDRLVLPELEASERVRGERRRWTLGPSPAALEKLQAARALGGLLAVTATVELSSVAVYRFSSADQLRIVALSASGYGIVALLLRTGARVPSWSLPATLGISTLLISAAIHFSGHSPSAYAFFYLWVVVYAFYFFPARHILPQLGLIGLSYAAVLSFSPQSFPPLANWAVTMITLLFVGLAIGGLRLKLVQALAKLRTDPLTDLPNRAALLKMLDSQAQLADQNGHPLSVLLLGIDAFRQINERCGNHNGDHALREVAALLRRHTRASDYVGRVGSSRFGILLPRTDTHGATVVCKKLREAAKAMSLPEVGPPTFSVGVAVFPADAHTGEGLILAGEEALAAARALGADRVVVNGSIARVMAMAHVGPAADLNLSTLVALAEALDVRDAGTAMHCRTVGRYAQMIARGLGLAEPLVDRLLLAGILHDVGKIGISDTILRKPGPLTKAEWEQMKEHPAIGARLLEHAKLDDIREWVTDHHERPDGRGYPRGLKDADISLGARILAVADAYEAMTADRVYRASIGPDKAREELHRRAGWQFDERVVHTFLRALEAETAG
jgi:diguanylate cyclase (GGDEF)-like protein